MDRFEETAGVGPGDASELCDACGALVAVGKAAVLWVSDSSAVGTDGRSDGERLLRACGERHLAWLAVRYRRRPFVPEELWAGQITRAVRLLGPLDDEEMYERVIEMTGLDEERLIRAVAWQDSHGRPSGAGPGA
ncbi:hypothetical protein ACFWOG_32900 [Kitasatospora sp. NPDC058406]|uniref:hypothetical protein n=1 Tax=Kitasatospora sp. NPDC058406 TaxID=3346483 RepID=UPI00365E2BB3